MVDLNSNVGVLRRWAHSLPGEPLPANFAQWRSDNPSQSLQLSKADPELVSLLDGTAPASLLADALQGQLSSVPVSQEEREAKEKQAEAQALYDASRSESGLNLTQKLRLQTAFPELAAKIQRETAIPAMDPETQALYDRQLAQEEAEIRAASVARGMAATSTHF